MTGKDLRIVFMGTPDFAVESLRALVNEGYNIVGVVTAPDRPAGRGQQLKSSAVKQYAQSVQLPLLQPEKLKNPHFLAQLQALKADLQIVVAFRMLPEAVWSMPPLGTFNLHASLLPQYRGAAPINWAIINGEHETGVSTFLLTHEIDTGAILFREPLPIGEHDNLGTVHNALQHIGAQLVLKTTDALASGSYIPQAQNELETTPLRSAPKIFKPDCQISWQKSAVEIHRLIRGLSPYPAAWSELVDAKGKQHSMKIYEAQIDDACQAKPGTVLTDGKSFLKVATANRWLRIGTMQLSGKKPMPVADFLRGTQQPEQLQFS